jgi:hypothetical protein
VVNLFRFILGDAQLQSDGRRSVYLRVDRMLHGWVGPDRHVIETVCVCARACFGALNGSELARKTIMTKTQATIDHQYHRDHRNGQQEAEFYEKAGRNSPPPHFPKERVNVEKIRK